MVGGSRLNDSNIALRTVSPNDCTYLENETLFLAIHGHLIQQH